MMGELIDALSTNDAIDSSRLAATGCSNGGGFTYTLACFIGDKITGIAPVSGLMWTGAQRDCELLHPTAVIGMHGTSGGDRPHEGWPGYLLSIDASHEHVNAHDNITDSETVTFFSDGGLDIERCGQTGGGGTVTPDNGINGQPVWFSFQDDGVKTENHSWKFRSQLDQDGRKPAGRVPIRWSPPAGGAVDEPGRGLRDSGLSMDRLSTHVPQLQAVRIRTPAGDSCPAASQEPAAIQPRDRTR